MRLPTRPESQPSCGPPAEADRALFDPSAVFEIASAEENRLLISMFIEQMRTRLPLLADADADADADAVHQIAHGLKGSAAMFGALLIMSVSDSICEIAQNGSVDGVAELYPQLVGAVADTESPMLAFVAGKPSTALPA